MRLTNGHWAWPGIYIVFFIYYLLFVISYCVCRKYSVISPNSVVWHVYLGVDNAAGMMRLQMERGGKSQGGGQGGAFTHPIGKSENGPPTQTLSSVLLNTVYV
jgi:hypothetical protein